MRTVTDTNKTRLYFVIVHLDFHLLTNTCIDTFKKKINATALKRLPNRSIQLPLLLCPVS